MSLSDRLSKIARGEQLPPGEIAIMRQEIERLERMASTVRGISDGSARSAVLDGLRLRGDGIVNGSLSFTDPGEQPDVPSLYLPFDMSLRSFSGAAPTTQTGGLIFQDAKFDEGIQTGEAATNLVTNPSFETNTTSWSSGGTATLAQSTVQAYIGSNSMTATYVSGSWIARYSFTGTAAAHVAGAWVYIPSDYDGTAVGIRFVNFSGATSVVNGAADMGIRDEWQFVLAFATPDAGDLAGGFDVYEGGTQPSVGKFIYIDAAACYAKAYWPGHVDGSLGAGHAWTGTAHASTSTRTATQLVYPVSMPDASEGTIICWAKPYFASTNTSVGDSYFFSLNDSVTNERFNAFFRGSDGTLRFQVYDGGAFQTGGSGAAPAFDAYDDLQIILTWNTDEPSFSLYANGSLISSSTASISVPTDIARIVVGALNGTTSIFNGVIDDLAILDRELTAAEVSSLYSGNRTFLSDGSRATISGWDGWQEVQGEAWTYVSATSFTVDGNKTAKYSKGLKLKVLYGSVPRYFYVTNAAYSSGVTTVTVTGGNDYSLTDSFISHKYYSAVGSPVGFPDWFAWSPTITGYSTNPTFTAYRFKIQGKTVVAVIKENTNGTSNATTTTYSAPVQAANVSSGSSWQAPCMFINNGTLSATPGMAFISDNGTNIDIRTNYALGAWTASGAKRVPFTMLSYEF